MAPAPSTERHSYRMCDGTTREWVDDWRFGKEHECPCRSTDCSCSQECCPTEEPHWFNAANEPSIHVALTPELPLDQFTHGWLCTHCKATGQGLDRIYGEAALKLYAEQESPFLKAVRQGARDK